MYAMHGEFARPLAERGHKVTGGAELAHSRRPASADGAGNAVTDGRTPRPSSSSPASTSSSPTTSTTSSRCVGILAAARAPSRSARPARRVRRVRFLVLLAEEDHFDVWEGLEAEQRRRSSTALAAFDQAVRERGQLLAGEALDRGRSQARCAPAPARPAVTDGPYAETAEQLGGFYVVDLPDLDDRRRDLRRLLPAPHGRGPARDPSTTTGRPVATRSTRAARRVGPAAGPARRAVPAARPGRGRPRRRVRGGGPHLAARRRTRQPAGLAADRGPAPDHSTGCAPRRSQPQAAAAGRRGRPHGGGAARHGRRRASRGARRAAAAGAALRAPGAAARGRRGADAAAGARRLDRGHRPAVPGPDPDDGGPADPGPQAAGRRVASPPRRRRARRTGSGSSPTSPTWPSRPATRPAPGPTCSAPTSPARRSGWCGCCATLLPGRQPSSTRCSR